MRWLDGITFPMSWLCTSGGQNIGASNLNNNPSNEYSGLISFRMDWFDLLAVQGTLKSLLQHHSSIYHQIWKTQQWPQDWKRSVFIPTRKKGNVKEWSNYCTIAFISHASKVMLKILQARLQQYVNHELPDIQAGFRKGRGTRDQIANIC